MDKNEWKKLIKSYASKIGSVAIDLDYLSEADFVIGYGYDETEKKWKDYHKVAEEDKEFRRKKAMKKAMEENQK